MNTRSSLEERLHASARIFGYPPTPPIGRLVRLRLGRRPVLRARHVVRAVVLALIVIAAAALAVPQVRAQVLEFLRIGVVRIFPAAPTAATLPPSAPQVPELKAPLTATPDLLLTPSSMPDWTISLEGLAGETSLETARDRLDFPILLPSVPADLGLPDRVFIQDRGQMVILVWMEKSDPERVRLSLHEIAPGSVLVNKYHPEVLEKTLVNGHEAAWVEGPYVVELVDGDLTLSRLVEGHTFLWEAGGITYRLESSLPLEQALPIAESVK